MPKRKVKLPAARAVLKAAVFASLILGIEHFVFHSILQLPPQNASIAARSMQTFVGLTPERTRVVVWDDRNIKPSNPCLFRKYLTSVIDSFSREAPLGIVVDVALMADCVPETTVLKGIIQSMNARRAGDKALRPPRIVFGVRQDQDGRFDCGIWKLECLSFFKTVGDGSSDPSNLSFDTFLGFGTLAADLYDDRRINIMWPTDEQPIPSIPGAALFLDNRTNFYAKRAEEALDPGIVRTHSLISAAAYKSADSFWTITSSDFEAMIKSKPGWVTGRWLIIGTTGDLNPGYSGKPPGYVIQASQIDTLLRKLTYIGPGYMAVIEWLMALFFLIVIGLPANRWVRLLFVAGTAPMLAALVGLLLMVWKIYADFSTISIVTVTVSFIEWMAIEFHQWIHPKHK